jgi:hypothetical protein
MSDTDAAVRGVVHVIEPTKTYGQRGFRKRLVVLQQSEERFVNYIPLEFTQDACDRVDELHVGDEVEITYRLSGRKWQKDTHSEVKYFLSAEARGFKVLRGKTESSKAAANDSFAEASNEDDEEIPF